MISKLIPIALLITTTSSQMGTFFLFDNIIYPSYSSWIVSYTINFTPYFEAVQNASLNVIELENLFSDFTNVQDNEYIDYKVKFEKMLQTEINIARQELRTVENSLNDLNYVATLEPPRKTKRALLPFLGDVLSGLFGVSTHKQLKKIKTQINSFKDKHNQLVHLVSESLSLLNSSNKEIQLNRNAINKLNDAVSGLKKEISYQLDNLKRASFNGFRFTRSLSVLQSSFHIIEANLHDITQEITKLTRNIERAMKGHLTIDLLSPRKIISLLTNVQNSLPPHISLPYPIERANLAKYYQLIEPTVLPDHYKTHVIFALPLVHLNRSYEIYHAIQVPEPNEDGTLGANYNLENNYLVISPHKSSFALLTPEEYQLCKRAPICKISSPIYNLNRNPMCISSLFIKDYSLIQTHCSKTITKLPKSPTVRHVLGRHYIISTPQTLKIIITCPESENSEILLNSVAHIEAPDGCSLSSDYFTIPPNSHGQSNLEQENRILNEVNLAKLVNNIWSDPSLNSLTNLSLFKSYNLSSLPAVSNLPVNQLQNLLFDTVHSHAKDITVRVISHRTFILVISVVTIFILFVICIVCALFYLRYIQKTYRKSNLVRYKTVRFAEVKNNDSEPRATDTDIAHGLLQTS